MRGTTDYWLNDQQGLPFFVISTPFTTDEVMRTPPYHPELQPIGTCWSVVKNHIAGNCNFTMKNLIDEPENRFWQVTSKTCAKIIAKVIKTEDQFWFDNISSDA